MALLDIIIGTAIGAVITIIILPFFLWIYYKYKETKVRKEIKQMIVDGKILKPLDKKDYDTEMWKHEINAKQMAEDLKNLNEKIFNKEVMIKNG